MLTIFSPARTNIVVHCKHISMPQDDPRHTKEPYPMYGIQAGLTPFGGQ